MNDYSTIPGFRRHVVIFTDFRRKVSLPSSGEKKKLIVWIEREGVQGSRPSVNEWEKENSGRTLYSLVFLFISAFSVIPVPFYVVDPDIPPLLNIFLHFFPLPCHL
jgi:hypothetical protein